VAEESEGSELPMDDPELLPSTFNPHNSWSSRWIFSKGFPYQTSVCILVSPTPARCPGHRSLIVLNYIS
jgi:hypothetical protein